MTALWLASLAWQIALPRYEEAMLRCAVYREVVRSEISSRAGTVAREETAGRDGILFLRAAPGDAGLTVVLWYDSLAVWRTGPEGRVAPETEGLLGGHWRGRLAPRGPFVRIATPFIPDEVGEIMDLRGAADDFLPLLPDSALPDGAEHRWTRRTASDSTTIVEDSLAVPVHRETSETGFLVWDPRRGPVRWERTIIVTARIPAGKPFRRGVVSTVKQLVRIERIADDCRN